MFGRNKKNKDAEAQDAFGHTEQTTTNVTVATSSTAHGEVLDPAAMPDLGNLMGALQDAMQESGGDPSKLPEEIKEHLHARGIEASVQTGATPTVITTSLGGMASPEDATLERLEKLGKLKADGLLTDEEFAAQKARILGT